MNVFKKLASINCIIEAHEKNRCPYCFAPLREFFHREKRKKACDNHPESLIIRDIDYISAIEYLLKYDDFKEIDKFRKLNEF